MSRGTIRFVLAFAVLAALASSSIAIASTRTSHHRGDDKKGETFTAHLTGYQETPALNSPGQGDLTLTIADGQMTYDLKYSGLSSAVSVAHVHIGQPGAKGDVSFFFCGGGSKPACPNSPTGTGEVTGTVAPADILGPATQGFQPGDFDAVVRAIEAGVAYANVHTANFPAGEIRGQLVQGDGHGHGPGPDDGHGPGNGPGPHDG